MSQKHSTKTLTRPQSKGHKPSLSLGEAGTALWDAIVTEYEVTDTGGQHLLMLACQALDRAEALRERIDAEGEIVSDARGNKRDHPGLKHELQNRSFVSKSLSRLGLDLGMPPRPVGRPSSPGIGINAEQRVRHVNGRHDA